MHAPSQGTLLAQRACCHLQAKALEAELIKERMLHANKRLECKWAAGCNFGDGEVLVRGAVAACQNGFATAPHHVPSIVRVPMCCPNALPQSADADATLAHPHPCSAVAARLKEVAGRVGGIEANLADKARGFTVLHADWLVKDHDLVALRWGVWGARRYARGGTRG